MSHIQEITEKWANDGLYSGMWYLVLISVAFIYYLMAVLSMIFTKESRRLREISLLHDNLIMSIMLPSLVEWLTLFASDKLPTGPLEIHLTPYRRIQVDTCRFVIFLYSSFQTSSVVALTYAIYAEKCLLPNMNCIKPKPVCNIRLLALQVITGLTVATATSLIDASAMNGSVNGCRLYSINAGIFEKTKDAIYKFSCICATYLLLRISIDRFLKLMITGHHSPSSIIYHRLQIS